MSGMRFDPEIGDWDTGCCRPHYVTVAVLAPFDLSRVAAGLRGNALDNEGRSKNDKFLRTDRRRQRGLRLPGG